MQENQEENFNMTNFPPGFEVNATLLSVVTGGGPGVVIQNTPIDQFNNSIGVAFYSSTDRSRTVTYNWMVVDSDAYEDEDFQHGEVDIRYNVFEKCVNVSFTKVYCSSFRVFCFWYYTKICFFLLF